ncbi:MAG: NAD(P)-dependent oxidoreductase, partial [Proteobacteria bacterium]
AFVHVEDAAQRFIAGAAKSYEGAHVFDMNGTPASVDHVLDLVRGHASSVALTVSGEPMPFPADDDDGALDALLQIETYRSIDRGVQDTMAAFEAARSRGISLDALFSQIMEKHA